MINCVRCSKINLMESNCIIFLSQQTINFADFICYYYSDHVPPYVTTDMIILILDIKLISQIVLAELIIVN